LTAQTLGLIKAGIDRIQTIETQQKRRTYESIAPVINHSEGFYDVRLLSGFSDLAVITPGQALPPDERELFASFRVYPLRHGRLYEWDADSEDDDVYGEMVARIPKHAVRAERRTMNKEGARLLSRAFTSGYTIYDGQLLASTAHTSAGGAATRANRPSTLVAMSSIAMEESRQSLLKTNDLNGEPMEYEGGIDVFTGYDLEPLCTRILTAMGLAGSADNDPNFMRGKARHILQPHITSTTQWVLRMRDEEEHGLRCIVWSSMKLHRFPEDRSLQKALGITSRFRFTVLQWEGTWFPNS
jgi:hypothetical protein